MRNMSFMLTTQQIKDEEKFVTRRLGWWFLERGDLVMACEKCQGLKKGEKINRIRPIEIIQASPSILNTITRGDVMLEGFEGMAPEQFVEMFCKHMKCKPDEVVNRIEFRYPTPYF